MSAGPIKQSRDAWRPKVYTQPESARVCAEQEARGYCGRKSGRRVAVWARVTCNDCRAAHNADAGRPVLDLLGVGS